jgi:3-mercaptopyruvate sulfurtransferase SseA
MRYVILSLCAILLSTVVLTACNSSAKPTVSNQTSAQPSVQTDTVHADGVRRITIAEAYELFKKGQAFVVDVRNQAAYDAGHIPGAKLIPVGEILNHVNEMPRDKTIITYCS